MVMIWLTGAAWVVTALETEATVLSISPSRASAWAQTVRIETQFKDGTIKKCFKKVAPL